MKATLAELEEIYEQLRTNESDALQFVGYLVKKEITRRKNCGRPRLGLSPKKYNRINQKTSRYKKKVREILAKR